MTRMYTDQSERAMDGDGLRKDKEASAQNFYECYTQLSRSMVNIEITRPLWSSVVLCGTDANRGLSVQSRIVGYVC